LECDIGSNLDADAVPKKRGPKTDVLEALLKRVDGLEARLKEQKTSGTESSGSQNATEKSKELSSSVQSTTNVLAYAPKLVGNSERRGHSLLLPLRGEKRSIPAHADAKSNLTVYIQRTSP
jgi:hypothetical protein